MLTPESNGDLQQDWTAARCARLLRRISAPLNALRKLNATTNAKATKPEIFDTRKSQTTSRKSPQAVERVSSDDEHKRPRKAGLDPDWIPAWSDKPSRPSASQNYSKRRLAAELSAPKRACAEQCVNFGTPQLQRIANRSADSTSPIGQTPWKPTAEDFRRQKFQAQDNYSKGFAPFVRPTGSRETHLANLRRGVDDLLRATERDRSSKRPDSGCSSLLSMCLRRLPRYVKLEQEEQAGLAEDEQTDRPTELINDLERHFATTSRGWRHLRVVVRAQALNMLVDAAREGLVPWAMLESQVLSMLPFDPAFGTVFDDFVNCKPMSIVNTSTQITAETTFVREICQSYTTLAALGSRSASLKWQGRFLQDFQPWVFNHLERMIAEGRISADIALAPSKSSFWQWAVSCILRTDTLGTSALRLLRTLMLASSGHPGAVTGSRKTLITTQPNNTLCAASFKSLMTIIKTLAGFALKPLAYGSLMINEQPSSSSIKARRLFLDASLHLLSEYSSIECASLLRLHALSPRTKIVLTNLLEISLMVLAIDSERVSSFNPRHADRIFSMLTSISKIKGASEHGNQSSFFVAAVEVIRRIQMCDGSEVIYHISSQVTERRSTGFIFAQRTEEHVDCLLRMAGIQLGSVIEGSLTTMKSAYGGRISFARPSTYDGDDLYRTMAVDDLGIDPIEVSQSTSPQCHAGDEWYETSDGESSSVEDTLDASLTSHTDPAGAKLQSAKPEQRDKYPHQIEESFQPQASPDGIKSRQTRPDPKKIETIVSERQPLRLMDHNISMSSRQKLKKQFVVNDRLPYISNPLIGSHVHAEEHEDSGYSSASTVSTFRERRRNHRKRTSDLFESVDRADSVGCSKKQRTSVGSRSSLGIAVTDINDSSEDELSFCN